MKQQKGITLIALIITVVVLLILAEVSISLVIGNNGGLTQASNATIKSREATAKEEVEMAVASAKTEYMKDWTSNTSKTLGEYLTAENLTKYTAGKGTVAQITPNEDGSYTVKYKSKDQGIIYTFTIDGNENVVLVGSEVGENSSSDETETTAVTASTVFSNPTAYYGKTVNYSANEVTDWKIFYSDGDNIYLISSDYVPNAKLPVSACEANTYETYGFYWKDAPETAQSPILAQKSWNRWTNYTSYYNAKCISTLLKTSNWDSFKNSYAEYAIGGPTLKMFCESWNAMGYTTLSCENSNEYGYYMGTSDIDIDVSSDDGYEDELYFPDQDQSHTVEDEIYGYWLASPSARNEAEIIGVWCDGVVACDYFLCDVLRVRPLVCLQSGVSLTEGTGSSDFDLNL